MFQSGRTYSVPSEVRSRQHRIGFGGPETKQSLSKLGVVEAVHFATVRAGEFFFSRDSDGRLVTFLVDRGSTGFKEYSTSSI